MEKYLILKFLLCYFCIVSLLKLLFLVVMYNFGWFCGKFLDKKLVFWWRLLDLGLMLVLFWESMCMLWFFDLGIVFLMIEVMFIVMWCLIGRWNWFGVKFLVGYFEDMMMFFKISLFMEWCYFYNIFFSSYCGFFKYWYIS